MLECKVRYLEHRVPHIGRQVDVPLTLGFYFKMASIGQIVSNFKNNSSESKYNFLIFYCLYNIYSRNQEIDIIFFY